jgi:hypothetical protein
MRHLPFSLFLPLVLENAIWPFCFLFIRRAEWPFIQSNMWGTGRPYIYKSLSTGNSKSFFVQQEINK